jgi:hypothetical protein
MTNAKPVLRETFFYEMPFNLCCAITARDIHDRFQSERIPQGIAKQIVVPQVSQREAECIKEHLGGLGKYRGYVHEAYNPEHKHPFFRDCNQLLIVEAA